MTNAWFGCACTRTRMLRLPCIPNKSKFPHRLVLRFTRTARIKTICMADDGAQRVCRQAERMEEHFCVLLPPCILYILYIFTYFTCADRRQESIKWRRLDASFRFGSFCACLQRRKPCVGCRGVGPAKALKVFQESHPDQSLSRVFIPSFTFMPTPYAIPAFVTTSRTLQ